MTSFESRTYLMEDQEQRICLYAPTAKDQAQLGLVKLLACIETTQHEEGRSTALQKSYLGQMIRSPHLLCLGVQDPLQSELFHVSALTDVSKLFNGDYRKALTFLGFNKIQDEIVQRL